ncbi:MAG: ASPIC/UnbV domain-containing protein [Acidobacteria bacterium]|nr:ASPIC/UnbV domain-containing protein [Acidobacteriota bacterium]
MSAVAHIKEYKTGRFFSDEFRGDSSWNGFEHNVLLRNEGADETGTPRFDDVAMATGADDIRDARGMAVADFDNDGDLDIVINNNPGDSGRAEQAQAVLLRNNTGERRNWLAVELRGTSSNRDAVGAVVTVESGGGKQLRYVTAGSGYASQQSARLYFGLGDQTQVNSLTVRWPGGLVQRFENVKAKQLAQITEGAGLTNLALPAKRDESARK